MLRDGEQTLVEARNISKSYGNDVVLHPVSFNVKEGSVLGLIGANGGGKTTILRMVSGIISQTSGTLNVLGSNQQKHTGRTNKEIAYMAQSFSMYGELTVRENLRFRADIYGINEAEKHIVDVLQQFNLEAYADMRAVNLSGGWARMLQLATSVLHQPKLLLLDEPTAGLDAYARQLVWQHIDKLAKSGIGIIISTHDLNEASQCNDVLLLSAGNLLASGSPCELINSSNICVYLFKNNSISNLSNVLDDSKIPNVITREHNNFRIIFERNYRDEFTTAASAANAEIVELVPNLTDASAVLIQAHKLKGEHGHV